MEGEIKKKKPGEISDGMSFIGNEEEMNRNGGMKKDITSHLNSNKANVPSMGTAVATAVAKPAPAVTKSVVGISGKPLEVPKKRFLTDAQEMAVEKLKAGSRKTLDRNNKINAFRTKLKASKSK